MAKSDSLIHYLWHSELHIALPTADPHISKEHITDVDAAIFLRLGGDGVRLL